MEWITLNHGVAMPLLGLGLYKATDREELETAVNAALAGGYTLFDTAQMYGNEAMLGEVLSKSGHPRQELFLTSKIDTGNMGRVSDSFDESLKKLQTTYLDLLLIHWPGQDRRRLVKAWKAMEALYAEGRVRAIGVCNCTQRHLEWILEGATVIPAINQVERHPLNNRKDLLDWCRAQGIQGEAWSPLLRGNLDMPPLRELAEIYGKTPAQIVLRWNLDNRCVVIPKSVHKERVLENMDVFDFTLSQEDLARIDSLHTGYEISRKIETYDF